jgi:hypothetical protein
MGVMSLPHDVQLPRPELPLVRHWAQPGTPLPVRVVRVPAVARRQPRGREAPPWLATGPREQPFDFCGHVRRLCADIAARCDALRHVDVSRVLFAVTQARNHKTGGLQARVTPLRCREGRLLRQRRGIWYQVQRYFVADREMLYLITFCLPRFLDQERDEKFITLFHELYHVSPAFDGDLRRHGRGGAWHADSKSAYDRHMADLARAYLASGPDPALHDFLRLNFAQLQHRHGNVIGVMVPRPRLVPVAEAPEPPAVGRPPTAPREG